MSYDFKKVPVYIFEKDERTKSFAKFCFEKLGYKDINFVSQGETFKDKYLHFAENAIKSESNYFIRSDADCLPFAGINDLLSLAIEENYDWLTGVYFDYVMNRFRGGTPQILSKEVLKILIEKSNLMPDSKKPETDFSIAIKDIVKMGDVKIFTNLHEFEQYPSKVCNSFLNRLNRGHSYLYNNSHLNKMPSLYKNAIMRASAELSRNKNRDNMHYKDFTDLDKNVPPLNKEHFLNLHTEYSILYNSLRVKYKKENK